MLNRLLLSNCCWRTLIPQLSKATNCQARASSISANLLPGDEQKQFRLTVQNQGFVSYDELKKEFARACSKEGTISDKSGSYLILVSGNKCVESNSFQKVALAEAIFASISNKSLSTYKALIKAYSENEYRFDWKLLLEKMKADGIQPDNMFNEKIFCALCSFGEMDSALEHLKSWRAPASDLSLLVSYIGYGHCVSGNWESALQATQKLIDLQALSFWKDYLRVLEGFAMEKTTCHFKSAFNLLTCNKDLPMLKESFQSVRSSEIVTLIQTALKYNKECLADAISLIPRMTSHLPKHIIKHIKDPKDVKSIIDEIYRQFISDNNDTKVVHSFYSNWLQAILSPTLTNDETSQALVVALMGHTSKQFNLLCEKLVFVGILNERPSLLASWLNSIQVSKFNDEQQFEKFDAALYSILSDPKSNNFQHFELLQLSFKKKSKWKLFFERMLYILSQDTNAEKLVNFLPRLKNKLVNTISNKYSSVSKFSESTIALETHQHNLFYSIVESACTSLDKEEFDLYLKQVVFNPQMNSALIYNNKFFNKLKTFKSLPLTLTNEFYLRVMQKGIDFKLLNNLNLGNQLFKNFPVTFIPADFLAKNQMMKTRIYTNRFLLNNRLFNNSLVMYFSYLKSGHYRKASSLAEVMNLDWSNTQVRDYIELGLTTDEIEYVKQHFNKSKPPVVYQACVNALLAQEQFDKLNSLLHFMVVNHINLPNHSKANLLAALCIQEITIPTQIISSSIQDVVACIRSGQINETLIDSMKNMIFPPAVLSQLMCKADKDDYEVIKAKLKQHFSWFQPEKQAAVLISRVDSLLAAGDISAAVEFVNKCYQNSEDSYKVWEHAVKSIAQTCHQKHNSLSLMSKINKKQAPQTAADLIDALIIYHNLDKLCEVDSGVLEKLVAYCHQVDDSKTLQIIYDYAATDEQLIKAFLITSLTCCENLTQCEKLIQQARLSSEAIDQVFDNSLSKAPSFEVLQRVADLHQAASISQPEFKIRSYLENATRFGSNLTLDDRLLKDVESRWSRVNTSTLDHKTIDLYAVLRHHLRFTRFSRNGRRRLTSL